MIGDFLTQPILIVDTETTGLNWSKHEIIQLAAEMILPGMEPKVFSAYKRIQFPDSVDPDAMKVNGIDVELLNRYGWSTRKLIVEFVGFLEKTTKGFIPDSTQLVWIGKNPDFDIRFLDEEICRVVKNGDVAVSALSSWFRCRHGRIAPLDIGQLFCWLSLLGLIKGDVISGLSLTELAARFDIDTEDWYRPHEAASDVAVVGKLIEKAKEIMAGCRKEEK